MLRYVTNITKLAWVVSRRMLGSNWRRCLLPAPSHACAKVTEFTACIASGARLRKST